MLTYEFPHGGGVLIGADDDSDINLFRATRRRREDENKNEAPCCIRSGSRCTNCKKTYTGFSKSSILRLRDTAS